MRKLTFAVRTFRTGEDMAIQDWINGLPGEVMTVGTDTYATPKTGYSNSYVAICVVVSYYPSE